MGSQRVRHNWATELNWTERCGMGEGREALVVGEEVYIYMYICTYTYNYDWFVLYSRNQHNIVKQLSSNWKQKEIIIITIRVWRNLKEQWTDIYPQAKARQGSGYETQRQGRLGGKYSLGKRRKPKEQIPQPPVLHPLSSCQPNSTRNQEARKSYFCFIDYAKAFGCVDHNKLWKLLKEVEIPDHLTCLLRDIQKCLKTAVCRSGSNS